MDGWEKKIHFITVLEDRDINLPTKACIVKVTVFPGVKYGCEVGHKEDWALEN